MSCFDLCRIQASLGHMGGRPVSRGPRDHRLRYTTKAIYEGERTRLNSLDHAHEDFVEDFIKQLAEAQQQFIRETARVMPVVQTNRGKPCADRYTYTCVCRGEARCTRTSRSYLCSTFYQPRLVRYGTYSYFDERGLNESQSQADCW